MKHSTLIARLMGPVLLIMGLGMALVLWRHPDFFTSMMKDVMGSPGLICLGGILALVAGVAIVNAHNVWEGDWRVIITILGWLAILRGTVSLLFPVKMQGFGTRMTETPAAPIIFSIALLVLGGILCAKGYEAECKKYCGAMSAKSPAPSRAAKPARKTSRRRRRR